MKKNKYTEPIAGVLTERMNVVSDDFQEFQKIVLAKSEQQNPLQKAIVQIAAIRIEMEDYIHSDTTGDMKLLGDFLKNILEVLNIRQNKFAGYIEIESSNLNKVIKGERQITPEAACRIGKALDLDPLLLMEIQMKNELRNIFLEKKSLIAKYSLKDLMKEQA